MQGENEETGLKENISELENRTGLRSIYITGYDIQSVISKTIEKNIID